MPIHPVSAKLQGAAVSINNGLLVFLKAFLASPNNVLGLKVKKKEVLSFWVLHGKVPTGGFRF